MIIAVLFICEINNIQTDRLQNCAGTDIFARISGLH